MQVLQGVMFEYLSHWRQGETGHQIHVYWTARNLPASLFMKRVDVTSGSHLEARIES